MDVVGKEGKQMGKSLSRVVDKKSFNFPKLSKMILSQFNQHFTSNFFEIFLFTKYYKLNATKKLLIIITIITNK